MEVPDRWLVRWKRMAKMDQDAWARVMGGLAAFGALLAATTVNDNDLFQISLSVVAGFCLFFVVWSFRPTHNAVARIQNRLLNIVDIYVYRKWKTSHFQEDDQIALRIAHKDGAQATVYLCDVYRRLPIRRKHIARRNLRENTNQGIQAVSEQTFIFPGDFGNLELEDGSYTAKWRALVWIKTRQYKPIIGRGKFKIRGRRLAS